MSRSLELTSNPPAVPVCIVRVCSFQCCPGCRCLDVLSSTHSEWSALWCFKPPSSVCWMEYALLRVIQLRTQASMSSLSSLQLLWLIFTISSVRSFPILIDGIKLKLSSLLSQLEGSFQPPSLLYCKENQSTHQSLNQLINKPPFKRGSLSHSWSQSRYKAKDDLELLVLLAPPLKSWGYMCAHSQ